jgi:hypothetical protein
MEGTLTGGVSVGSTSVGNAAPKNGRSHIYIYLSIGIVVGLLAGFAGGYYLGMTQGIAAAMPSGPMQLPYNNTPSANPLDSVPTNPLQGVQTNPFQ